MSADRYEITDNGASIRCQKPGKGPLILYFWDHDSSTQKIIAVIRQLQADLAAMTAERDRLATENAALLAANRDCKDHFDALKGDYDEAAHFARHFVRDDPEITPRGAIIRLGDKCTDLFVRLQQAEKDRDGWIACHAQLFRKLGNLLAVIHRDGGHYQSEHGIDKAIEDAQQRICDTFAGLGAADELAMLVRRLAHALQKAWPDSDLPKVAMDYLSIAGLAGSPLRQDE